MEKSPEAESPSSAKQKAKLSNEHYCTIGARGGQSTKARGREHYERVGRLGGNTLLEAVGVGHFKQIGTKGGQALVVKRGAEHLREIGRKGGLARQAQLAAMCAQMAPNSTCGQSRPPPCRGEALRRLLTEHSPAQSFGQLTAGGAIRDTSSRHLVGNRAALLCSLCPS